MVDLKFLHGSSKPTVAMLWKDPRDAKHLKTFTITSSKYRAYPTHDPCLRSLSNLGGVLSCVVLIDKDKDITVGWSQSNVDKGASMLIPVPGKRVGERGD